jgi:alpha-N-arabinofuranosidase
MRTRWETAPRLIEDEFSALDAVVVGSLLLTLMNHADRVKIACQAQLVNVIAPILTEPGGTARKQPIFYPFADVAHHGQGEVLRVDPICGQIDTEKFGLVPVLQIAATRDPESRSLTLFAVNRHQSSFLTLAADVRHLPDAQLVDHRVLSAYAQATSGASSEREPILPHLESTTTLDECRLEARLPPLSWNVIRIVGNRP